MIAAAGAVAAGAAAAGAAVGASVMTTETTASAIPVSEPLLPVAVLARLARSGVERSSRIIFGLVGPPASGKSTAAAAIARHLNAQNVRCVVVPMDGFHLAQSELHRLGRANRKGAPDTFDADGFVALLRRLRNPRGAGEVIYAPEFNRSIEEAIAGAIPVDDSVAVVITEGNYLLHTEGKWVQVRPLLDEVWYVEAEEELRLARLQRRHVAFGRNEAEAAAWIAATDEPNARQIESHKARADFVLQWS